MSLFINVSIGSCIDIFHIKIKAQTISLFFFRLMKITKNLFFWTKFKWATFYVYLIFFLDFRTSIKFSRLLNYKKNGDIQTLGIFFETLRCTCIFFACHLKGFIYSKTVTHSLIFQVICMLMSMHSQYFRRKQM